MDTDDGTADDGIAKNDEVGTGGADTRDRSVESVGVGVLGGGSFVARRAVLPAIARSERVHLAAIASVSSPIDPPYRTAAVADYDAVLAHPDAEADYLPLPNGLHEEWTIKAALAGKHVLCEKPLAPTSAAAARMADACRARGTLLAEAWMTPFDPRWQRVVSDIERGTIGDVDRVDARFTFTIGPEANDNYRWRADQGGGALLDVGIYALGLPTTLWGPEVESVVVLDRLETADGVDSRTDAELRWPGGRCARIVCSFVDDEAQRLSAVGGLGTLTVAGDAFTGGNDATRHHIDDGAPRDVVGPGGDPYQAMVEAFAAAVRHGDPWPRPLDASVKLLQLIEQIARTPITSSEPAAPT